MAWVASNIVHGRIGRMWMAVRDMDIAAELIGIRLLPRQAARLRGVVVLYRRRRRADGVPVVRRAPSRRRSTSTCRSSCCSWSSSAGSARSSAPFSARRSCICCRSCCAPLPPLLGLHDRRRRRVEHLTFMIDGRADHRRPHRRAARPGAAVADGEAETARLAISLLKCKRPKEETQMTNALNVKSACVGARRR